MPDWYCIRNNEQQGPLSGAQLKSLAAGGELNAEDLVWNETMPEWVPANRVRGLFPQAQPANAVASTPAKAPSGVAGGGRAAGVRTAGTPAPRNPAARSVAVQTAPVQSAPGPVPAPADDSSAPETGQAGPLPLSTLPTDRIGYHPGMPTADGVLSPAIVQQLLKSTVWIWICAIGCGVLGLLTALSVLPAIIRIITHGFRMTSHVFFGLIGEIVGLLIITAVIAGYSFSMIRYVLHLQKLRSEPAQSQFQMALRWHMLIFLCPAVLVVLVFLSVVYRFLAS